MSGINYLTGLSHKAAQRHNVICVKYRCVVVASCEIKLLRNLEGPVRIKLLQIIRHATQERSSKRPINDPVVVRK